MRGSVNKRGKFWQVRVDLGPDPVSSKRRQASKTLRTRKEAEIELARWLREIDTGTTLDPLRMTFGEFLDHWLEEHLRHRLRPATYNSYRAQIRLHIRPTLGDTPLQKLQPMQIQALYSAKLASERADGRDGGGCHRSRSAISMGSSIRRSTRRFNGRWCRATSPTR